MLRTLTDLKHFCKSQLRDIFKSDFAMSWVNHPDLNSQYVLEAGEATYPVKRTYTTDKEVINYFSAKAELLSFAIKNTRHFWENLTLYLIDLAANKKQDLEKKRAEYAYKMSKASMSNPVVAELEKYLSENFAASSLRNSLMTATWKDKGAIEVKLASVSKAPVNKLAKITITFREDYSPIVEIFQNTDIYSPETFTVIFHDLKKGNYTTLVRNGAWEEVLFKLDIELKKVKHLNYQAKLLLTKKGEAVCT